MDNDSLMARFEVEHFDRQSISLDRRVETRILLARLAASLPSTLDAMTPSDLMAWQGRERARGRAPTTITKMQGQIMALMSWAAVAGIVSFEDLARLKLVQNVAGGAGGKPRPYKRAEIQRFREVLDAKYPIPPTKGTGCQDVERYLDGRRAFHRNAYRYALRLQYEAQVSLALEEGLRRTEIRALTIPQMHHDNAAVVVFTAKGKPGEHREREVPYTDHSRLCVQEWLEFRWRMAPPHAHPWLALANRGWQRGGADPLVPQSRTQLKEALDRFEDGPWCWHRFRHTFATERLRAGMPLEKVQKMMGHAKLEQTLAYAEIVNADVATEAERTNEAFARNLGLAA